MQPKYAADALLVALAKLDPSHPGFNGCQEVRAALNNMNLRLYLDSWVIPAIGCAAGDPEYKWNRGHVAHDAHRIRQALQEENAT